MTFITSTLECWLYFYWITKKEDFHQIISSRCQACMLHTRVAIAWKKILKYFGTFPSLSFYKEKLHFQNIFTFKFKRQKLFKNKVFKSSRPHVEAMTKSFIHCRSLLHFCIQFLCWVFRNFQSIKIWTWKFYFDFLTRQHNLIENLLTSFLLMPLKL